MSRIANNPKSFVVERFIERRYFDSGRHEYFIQFKGQEPTQYHWLEEVRSETIDGVSDCIKRLAKLLVIPVDYEETCEDSGDEE